MIAVGNVETIHIFVGTHEVNKVYLGDTQIYPKLPKRLIFNPSTPYTTDYTAKSFVVNVDTDLRYWFVNVDQGNDFCSVEIINSTSFRVTVTKNSNASNRNARIGIYVNPNERVSYFELTQTYSNEFELIPNSANVSANAQDKFISVIQHSYPDWYVEKGGTESWYTISRESGIDGFAIHFSRNESRTSRSAIINVYRVTGDTPIQYSITQQAAEYFEVSPNTLNFTQNGGNKTLNIDTNIPYTVSSEDSWITYEKSASGDTVVVTVPSGAVSSRTGTIIFNTSIGTFNVTVNQTISIENVVINAEYHFWDNNFGINSNKTITTAFVLSGFIKYNNYSENNLISIPFTKNIPVGFNTGTIDVEIPKDSYNISVDVEEITTTTQSINVETIGTAFAMNPVPPITVEKEGGTIRIHTLMQGNVTDFTPYLYGGEGFCNISKNNGDIVLTVPENLYTSTRTDIIGVRVVVNGVTREFTHFNVTQEAQEEIYTAVPNRVDINFNDTTSHRIDVQTSGGDSILPDDAYMTYGDSYFNGDIDGSGYAVVNAKGRNTSGSSYAGTLKIEFTAEGVSKYIDVPVTQASGSEDTYTISPTSKTFAWNTTSEQSFVVKNSNNVEQTIKSVSLSGVNANKFSCRYSGINAYCNPVGNNTSGSNYTATLIVVAQTPDGDKTFNVNITQEHQTKPSVVLKWYHNGVQHVYYRVEGYTSELNNKIGLNWTIDVGGEAVQEGELIDAETGTMEVSNGSNFRNCVLRIEDPSILDIYDITAQEVSYDPR